MSTGEQSNTQRKAPASSSAVGTYDTGPEGDAIVEDTRMDRPPGINKEGVPAFNTQSLPLDTARTEAGVIPSNDGGAAISGNFIWVYEQTDPNATCDMFIQDTDGDPIPMGTGLQVMVGQGFDRLFFDHNAQSGESFDFAFGYFDAYKGRGTQILSTPDPVDDTTIVKAGTYSQTSAQVSAGSTETILSSNNSRRGLIISNEPTVVQSGNTVRVGPSGSTGANEGHVLEPGNSMSIGDDLPSGFTPAVDVHNFDPSGSGNTAHIQATEMED